MKEKTKLAIGFCSRPFFQKETAQEDQSQVLDVLAGNDIEAVTLPLGTVLDDAETAGQFANLLRTNREKLQGIVFSLVNFGDESVALYLANLLKELSLPIFVHGLPDEADKLDMAHRRDTFCGKNSFVNVLNQCGIPFTVLAPMVVAPRDPAFGDNVDYFAGVCRVVSGMKDLTVLALGAPTTAFKTVRVDPITLQKHGIRLETLDLLGVYDQMERVDAAGIPYKGMLDSLRKFTGECWGNLPEPVATKIVKAGVVFNDLIDQYGAQVVAIRCWQEFQQLAERLGFSVCTLLAWINAIKGVSAACEVDVLTGIMQRVFSLATGNPALCLDFNNNTDDPNRMIGFHCGVCAGKKFAVPGTMNMEQHAILGGSFGLENTWGCFTGRIPPIATTTGNCMTSNGHMLAFLADGQFVDHTGQIPDNFFGYAGIAEIPKMQSMMLLNQTGGFHHHAAFSLGRQVSIPVLEALVNYLGWGVYLPQQMTELQCRFPFANNGGLWAKFALAT